MGIDPVLKIAIKDRGLGPVLSMKLFLDTGLKSELCFPPNHIGDGKLILDTRI